jgi:hypothetical protein
MLHRGRSFERFAVLAVIVAAHVLFLEILIRNGKSYVRMSSQDSERGELFFFEIPPPPEEPITASKSERAARQQRAHVPEASNAITLSREEEPPPDADIDWIGDAAAVAREGLDKSTGPKPRAFGEQPKSPYDKSKQRKPGYEWQPEEKKAGFVGPLPYFRLGKRCVVMPPFFGCVIGKLPKGGGATLDEMRDPDRPRDSVPDPEP